MYFFDFHLDFFIYMSYNRNVIAIRQHNIKKYLEDFIMKKPVLVIMAAGMVLLFAYAEQQEEVQRRSSLSDIRSSP